MRSKRWFERNRVRYSAPRSQEILVLHNGVGQCWCPTCTHPFFPKLSVNFLFSFSRWLLWIFSTCLLNKLLMNSSSTLESSLLVWNLFRRLLLIKKIILGIRGDAIKRFHNRSTICDVSWRKTRTYYGDIVHCISACNNASNIHQRD